MENKKGNSISTKVLLRLAAQADEADICGNFEVAQSLTNQIANIKVRANDEQYEYSKEEMEGDVKNSLWEAVTRIVDYYDETPDSKDLEQIIKFNVENLIESVENLMTKDIGPNEPKSPGQDDDDDDDDIHEESNHVFKITEMDEDEDDEDEDEDEDDEKDNE